LRGLPDHGFVHAPALRVDLPDVNASQDTVRRQIVGIRLDGLLGVRLAVAHAAALAVQIGQLLGQERRIRIGLNGGFVIFDRQVHVVITSGGVPGQLCIHVTQRVVVIGSRPVGTRDRSVGLPPARPHAQQHDQEYRVQ
jgi:hypothetical protein